MAKVIPFTLLLLATTKISVFFRGSKVLAFHLPFGNVCLLT